MAQVIRTAMIIMSWPLLNGLGYPVQPQEAVVLCWSGLRGAVGLSLALFVLLDGQIPDQRFRTLTFFHMGCVAFLTIILQGTSMKPLLQVGALCLQLQERQSVKSMIFDSLAPSLDQA